MQRFKNFFRYTFDFLGVENRKDFWIVFGAELGLFALVVGLSFVTVVFQYIGVILFLGLILPTLSLIVRRLHDTDRGAIYLLWWLIPFVGQFIVLVFLLEKTKYFVPSKA